MVQFLICRKTNFDSSQYQPTRIRLFSALDSDASPMHVLSRGSTIDPSSAFTIIMLMIDSPSLENAGLSNGLKGSVLTQAEFR